MYSSAVDVGGIAKSGGHSAADEDVIAGDRGNSAPNYRDERRVKNVDRSAAEHGAH